jgi:hypothetical protein
MKTSNAPARGFSPDDWIAIASFLGMVAIIVWQVLQ